MCADDFAFSEADSDSSTYIFSKADGSSNMRESKPNRFSGDKFISKKPVLLSRQVRSTSTTASGYVSYDTLGVLTYLRSLFPYSAADHSSASSSSPMDKVVRTQPNILLAKPRDIRARVRFLVSTVLQPTVAANIRQLVVLQEEQASFESFISLADKYLAGNSNTTTTITSSSEKVDNDPKIMRKKAEMNALLALILAYPSVLSIDVRLAYTYALSCIHTSAHAYLDTYTYIQTHIFSSHTAPW